VVPVPLEISTRKTIPETTQRRVSGTLPAIIQVGDRAGKDSVVKGKVRFMEPAHLVQRPDGTAWTVATPLGTFVSVSDSEYRIGPGSTEFMVAFKPDSTPNRALRDLVVEYQWVTIPLTPCRHNDEAPERISIANGRFRYSPINSAAAISSAAIFIALLAVVGGG
jgi:hypothetical protein